ncbi:MAG: recombination mediator RecR [Bacteroidales bacterium]
MVETYSSTLLQRAVTELKKLPGIGEKTALRLALHLLNQPEEVAVSLGEAVTRLRKEVKYCKQCHNISDSDICAFCSDSKRNASIICVVEDIRDMLAIENTGQFTGKYHILGGLISPINGIGPDNLNISALVDRVKQQQIEEIILALPSTVDGDITNHYIYNCFKSTDIRISIIARGIPIGDELDYTDEVTLGRSIIMRQKYEGG